MTASTSAAKHAAKHAGPRQARDTASRGRTGTVAVAAQSGRAAVRVPPACRHLVVGAAIAVAAFAVPMQRTHAQTPLEERAAPRSELPKGMRSRAGLFSLLGAASGGVLALGYHYMSQTSSRPGGCRPFSCAMPFLTISGAISGLFISRELDAQRRAESPRVGDVLSFGFSEAAALASPTAIDVRDSLVAVVSDSGAQLFSATASPKALRRRGTGLSNMRQVAIVPTAGSLVFGTSSALWEASLTSGPAARIADGPVDALATSRDAVLSASGRSLRLRRGSGASARYDSLTLDGAVVALAYDSVSTQWWAALDSSIVQVTVGEAGLRTALTFQVPATARAIATNGEWIAAALGDGGVIAWRRATLGDSTVSPVRVTQEPRFAYDLTFLGDQLFVAGGVDGLFRLSLAPEARVVGSSRQFPFATSIRSQGGAVWVGDRSRRSVVRVTP